MNKLSSAKAIQIAALIRKGYSVREVAKRANVSRKSVHARTGRAGPTLGPAKIELKKRQTWLKNELAKVTRALKVL